MSSISLIDDDPKHLSALRDAVVAKLNGGAFEVTTWVPTTSEKSVEEQFTEHVGEDVVLVVTDYDLTRDLPGLFGTSVVAWCQKLALPVADYSRGDYALLPTIPDVFEFRLPKEVDLAATEIVAVAEGFQALRDAIASKQSVLEAPSPAVMLAEILERPSEVPNFALYELQLGSYKSVLERWRENSKPNVRERIATYMLGHLLFNLILRYPGPILDARAVEAYFAIQFDMGGALLSLLEPARYNGPFERMKPYYWRARIDDVVEGWSNESNVEAHEDLAIYRRRLAEEKVGEKFKTHDCKRCGGERGGYICPFTDRIVCEREDCSVGTTSWLPHGAEIARVEKEYYEETEPMLGF